MKKILLVLLLFSFSLPVFSDAWDDFSNVDRMWDGQKTITNQEFEQVMDALQENEKKKETKAKKKKNKKISGGGTSLHNELNPENEINEVSLNSIENEELIINIPVNLILDGKPLEKGFYKVLGERDEDSGRLYIKFYQSQFLKGQVEANETQDDFNEKTLNFAKLQPFDENFVKIIYGSIDFNAYCYVHYINE